MLHQERDNGITTNNEEMEQDGVWNKPGSNDEELGPVTWGKDFSKLPQSDGTFQWTSSCGTFGILWS